MISCFEFIDDLTLKINRESFFTEAEAEAEAEVEAEAEAGYIAA